MQAFEEELISVSRDRDNFQLKFVSAESALEEAKKQKKQLEDLTQKLSDANNTIELQKHEISALKVSSIDYILHPFLATFACDFDTEIILEMNRSIHIFFIYRHSLHRTEKDENR